MKFYCIIEQKDEDAEKRYGLLEAACKKRKIKFILINAHEYNYLHSAKPSRRDLVYRATRGARGKTIERFFLNEGCVSLRKDSYERVHEKFIASLYYSKNGLPGMPTILNLPRNKEEATEYVKHLGGLPVIVKAIGNSHGVGVMKIDSIEGLVSTSDYLRTIDTTSFIMRKFIRHKRQARLIVLGNKVIASHENVRSMDFRTNTGDNAERKRRVVVYPKKIQAIAVKAVKISGLDFGGVDILFDEKNKPYIAEINFPCFFPTTQNLTGIDIAGAIVDHLVKKSKKARGK